MNFWPVKKEMKKVPARQGGKVEVLNPAGNRNSFVRFSYSYQSMSFADGKTHIRSRKETFQNGKLESEEFEGTAEGDFCTGMAKQMEQAFCTQISSFFRPFSFFLPFSPSNFRLGFCI
ncbi:MAG: hypothetical protein R2941_23750 [Desulfobacterales bacterium]